MTCAQAATSYQRDWLKGLRGQITDGAPFAFVNADTPHELFHFMDVPMVTNQWWSAVIAAKQLAPDYFDRVAYPEAARRQVRRHMIVQRLDEPGQ